MRTTRITTITARNPTAAASPTAAPASTVHEPPAEYCEDSRDQEVDGDGASRRTGSTEQQQFYENKQKHPP
jgi:hypothetical protein